MVDQDVTPDVVPMLATVSPYSPSSSESSSSSSSASSDEMWELRLAKLGISCTLPHVRTTVRGDISTLTQARHTAKSRYVPKHVWDEAIQSAMGAYEPDATLETATEFADVATDATYSQPPSDQLTHTRTQLDGPPPRSMFPHATTAESTPTRQTIPMAPTDSERIDPSNTSRMVDLCKPPDTRSDEVAEESQKKAEEGSSVAIWTRTQIQLIDADLRLKDIELRHRDSQILYLRNRCLMLEAMLTQAAQIVPREFSPFIEAVLPRA